MTCPKCGYKLEAHTEVTEGFGSIGEGLPEPGDVALCFNCEAVLERTESGFREIAVNNLDLDTRHRVAQVRFALLTRPQRLRPKPDE